MIYGYARCSTNETKQDIQRQTRELKTAGAEKIFLEYEHGDSAVKEQLSTLLETAQAGVKDKCLRLSIVGSICVDCSSGQIDPMTNAFIQISGVFAELELRIIRDRVRSGMANARAKGRRIGRPQATADDIPASFLRHYPAYKAGKMNLSELARICGLSRTTVYKYIGLLEG